MTPILKTAKEIFTWAKSQLPSNCEVEIFMSQGRGRSVVWSEKKCEDINQAEGGGVGMRVIEKLNSNSGRQGFAFTTSYSRENVLKTVQNALNSAQMLPEEAFKELPFPSGLKEKKIPAETLYDSSVFQEKLAVFSDRLKEGENRILKKYPFIKSVLRARLSEGISETAIINSKGIEASFSGTHTGLGVSCLAEKDGERQEGGFGLTKRFKKDLDWEAVIEKSAQRTLALLGGKPIPSGSVPVIFDPTVACEFLSLVSGMVCADAVQKGKSALAQKIGHEVASKSVSLIDDGTLEKGIATSPVDDEGTPTQTTVIMNQGRLEHYLYDTHTALKDKTVSTGNASRSGFKGSPSSGPSNFYMQPGTGSRKKLLQETQGLYLYEVMGLHMADPISGDFSVAAIGAWLENGEFKYGVRGITLAGNLITLLKNIDVVCDDLDFFGSVGSPTFRVQGLTISGT